MGSPIDVSDVRRFPPFADLGEEDIAAATDQLVRVTLTRGQVLFRQGELGSSAYVVVNGEVDVRADGDGSHHHLDTVAVGESLGELGLLIEEPRSASVIAPGGAELLEITREAFEKGLRRGDAWANRFLLAAAKNLARRLGAVNQQLLVQLDQARKTGREPAARVAELEQLRRHLFSNWSF